MDNHVKAERILDALESGKVPISWHSIHYEALVQEIAAELGKIEREENDHGDVLDL